jgi:general secretion pathway protein C
MKIDQLWASVAGSGTLLGDRARTPAAAVDRLNDIAPFALSLTLVVMVGWLAARAAWLVYPAPAAVEWIPPPVAARNVTSSSNEVGDVQPIVAAHLFGEPVAGAPAGEAPMDAPDTSLNLQLRAAVVAGNPRFAHAIIADAGGQERVYFLNDGLPGGATLQRVELDRVVLGRNGAFEVLRLPRLGSGDSRPPQAAARPTLAPAAAMANVQEVVSRNAAGFLDIIRPQPFMPDGQLKGYRIFPGPNRDQFTALGLRPGDLVTEINGVTLNNPAQGMEVFRSLGETAEVSVTVERDGQPTVLSLNLAQVSTLGGATQ